MATREPDNEALSQQEEGVGASKKDQRAYNSALNTTRENAQSSTGIAAYWSYQEDEDEEEDEVLLDTSSVPPVSRELLHEQSTMSPVILDRGNFGGRTEQSPSVTEGASRISPGDITSLPEVSSERGFIMLRRTAETTGTDQYKSQEWNDPKEQSPPYKTSEYYDESIQWGDEEEAESSTSKSTTISKARGLSQGKDSKVVRFQDELSHHPIPQPSTWEGLSSLPQALRRRAKLERNGHRRIGATDKWTTQEDGYDEETKTQYLTRLRRELRSVEQRISELNRARYESERLNDTYTGKVDRGRQRRLRKDTWSPRNSDSAQVWPPTRELDSRSYINNQISASHRIEQMAAGGEQQLQLRRLVDQGGRGLDRSTPLNGEKPHNYEDRTSLRLDHPKNAYEKRSVNGRHIGFVNKNISKPMGPTDNPIDQSSDTDSDTSYTFALPTTDKKWAAPPLEVSDKQKLSVKETWRSATGAAAPPINGVKTDLKVVHSYYPDVTAGANNLVIGISAESEASGIQDSFDALFRWIHLQQPVMNFEGFINCALSAEGITDSEVRGITRVLDAYRDEKEKPFKSPQGGNGRCLAGGTRFGPLTSEYSSDSNQDEKKSVLFFCLPYLSLEALSTQAHEHYPGAHVTRTLLQTLFSSTGKDREMQQAVCQIQHTPKHFCFHVPQLWCLLIDERILVTCTRTPLSKLQESAVNATIQPPKFSFAPKTQYIHLLNGHELFLLPVKNCQTWFEFTAHFMSSDNRWCDRDYCLGNPDGAAWCYAVKFNNRLVMAQDWPSIFTQSWTSQIRLKITRKMKHNTPNMSQNTTLMGDESDDSLIKIKDSSADEYTSSDDSQADIWKRQSRRKTGTKYSFSNIRRSDNRINVVNEKLAKSAEEFCVFSWIAMVPSVVRLLNSATDKASYVVDGSKINEALIPTLKFLWKNPKTSDRIAFRECSSKSIHDVFDRVRYMARNSIHYGVFVAAKDILRFFLPLDFEAHVVLKYWGGVCAVIDNLPNLDPLDVEDVYLLASFTRSLRLHLSDQRAPSVAKLRVPQEFVKAWLHCVSFFISLGTRYSNGLHRHHHEKCLKAFEDGRLDLVRLFCRTKLAKTEAAPAIVIATKLCHRLLQDMTDNHSDLISSYWTYVGQLELGLSRNPLQREHQRKIGLLKQELDAAQKIFEEQARVMEDIINLIGKKYGTTNSNHKPRSRETSIAHECLSTVEEKLRALKDISERASNLSIENLRMIESNKDKQEAAIYIFTTVTVIFLPLSFVAGVLGMNTNDIRNMSINQWVFWAAAFPFTTFVVAICLFFTGELRSVWQWLASFGPANRQDLRGVTEAPVPSRSESVLGSKVKAGATAHYVPDRSIPHISSQALPSTPLYSQHISYVSPRDGSYNHPTYRTP